MADSGLFSRLRKFDAYPKTLEDFRVKTTSGAAVSIVAGVLMFVLFASELNYFLTTEVSQQLFVDTGRNEKLRINLDVSFPKMPCAYLSLDVMDISGEQQMDVSHDVFKRRLDVNGNVVDETKQEELGHGGNDTAVGEVATTMDPNRCESCYGAENPEIKCCNTCEQVREAYRKKGWAFTKPDGIIQCEREGWSQELEAQANEGCQIRGHLLVNKVAGNFHFAPGKSFSQHNVHIHDMHAFGMKAVFNMTHTVNHLSFGTDYPGILNPLDDHTEINLKGSAMYQYFVKVVPTRYIKVSGKEIPTNQFSVTTHQRTINHALGQSGLPGVFFMFEISPLQVQISENRRSFMHFLTGVCAIIGGVFTVAGIVDSVIYHSLRTWKKQQLGKIG